jgi:hypothetical protein
VKRSKAALKSADEVIMASLRLLSAQEQGMETLRLQIMVGIEDIQLGRFTSCASDSELEAFSDEIIRERREGQLR